MDDILKFQRIQVGERVICCEINVQQFDICIRYLQGPLDEVFKAEKICSSCIDTNILVLGAESGMIYIVNFSGQIVKSIKCHTKAVNDISVDNNNGLTIVR